MDGWSFWNSLKMEKERWKNRLELGVVIKDKGREGGRRCLERCLMEIY